MAKYAYYGKNHIGVDVVVYAPLWLKIINNILRIFQIYTEKKYLIYVQHEIKYDGDEPTYRVIKYHFGKLKVKRIPMLFQNKLVKELLKPIRVVKCSA